MQYMNTTTIFVTTEFVQLHKWAEAPLEVGYLADLHRHLFKVQLEIEVLHNDRELEYHTILRELGWMISEELLRAWNIGWSCEDVAQRILTWAKHKYPERTLYRVTVSEDGENGSIMEAKG